MTRSARCCTIRCSKDYWVGESEGSVRKDRQLIVDYLAAGDWPSVVLNRPGRKGNTHRP